MISIIIPTYNEYNCITQKVDFILKELSANDEIVIVDANKSTDRLMEYTFPARVRIVKSRTTSRAIQLNEGATLAQNKVLFFLHADVLPPKGFRHLILDTLNGGTEIGSFSYAFDSKNLFLKINASFTKREGLFAGGGDQGLFLRKELFFDLGQYDETLQLMEDFDFYDRFKKRNHSYKIVTKDALVSARKYNKNSWLRVNLVQGLVFLKYKLGHSQESTIRLYRKWIR